MSHVAVIDLHIKDLDSLDEACKMLGLTLVRNKSNWRWFGRWVDDYHAQDAAFKFGINPNEYGNCAEHVITVAGNNEVYEIGVVKRRDGKAGWMLLFDFWAGGNGMKDFVGNEKCSALKQAYSVCVAKKSVIAQGYKATIKKAANGHMQVIAEPKKKVVRH